MVAAWRSFYVPGRTILDRWRLASAVDRCRLGCAWLAGTQLAHDLGATAAGIVHLLALAAGTRRVPVSARPDGEFGRAGLDDDPVTTRSGRSYRTTDVASKHSLAAVGSTVARWLGPDDVERDTRFELATFSLGTSRRRPDRRREPCQHEKLAVSRRLKVSRADGRRWEHRWKPRRGNLTWLFSRAIPLPTMTCETRSLAKLEQPLGHTSAGSTVRAPYATLPSPVAALPKRTVARSIASPSRDSSIVARNGSLRSAYWCAASRAGRAAPWCAPP